MACYDDTFKLPMRRWLSDLVERGQITGLEWFDKDRKFIKIPWTKMHYPGWESCNQVVTAWADHQHRDEKKGAKSDFSTLKANFRNALRKSEDFDEDKSLTQLDNQTGNFKVYRILTRAEVEANKLEKKKANADLAARKRKKQLNSLPGAGGKLVCSEQNYDDGLMKKVADKDLTVLGSSQMGYSPGFCISPPLPDAADGDSSCHMNFHDHGNATAGFDINQFQPESTTVVPMQCTSDGTYIDPVSLSMHQNNIQCTEDLAPMTIPPQLNENDGSINHAFPTPTDMHLCELTITYNDTPVLQDELRTANKGFRLHYGDASNLKQALKQHFMPESEQNDFNLSSIRLPNPKSDYKRLQDILNFTELGLTFRYDEDTCSFYMKRLCQSQIFYLNPHVPQQCQVPIKIERNQEVCVFSYDQFFSATKCAIDSADNQRLVYPFVYFSIGSKSNLELNSPSRRGIKGKIVMNAPVLKQFIEESIVSGEMSCYVSRPNRMDIMLDKFKNMNVTSICK